MRNIYLYLTSNDLSGAINDENVCALGNILNGLKSGGGGKAFSARTHHHQRRHSNSSISRGHYGFFCLDRVSTIACILQEGTMPTLLNNLFALPAATMIAQTTVSLRK